MGKVVKNAFWKSIVILVIFSLVTGWVFSGWPQLLEFRIQNIEYRVPPEIQEAQAADCPAGWTDLGDGRCRLFITDTAQTTFSVPSDWNNASNVIEVIGGGGDSGSDTSGGFGGGGGGGYSSIANADEFTPDTTVTIRVGAAAQTTYLCKSQSNCASIAGADVIVGANAGAAGSSTTGGAGATTTGAVGDTLWGGGKGGNASGNTAGGGGGAGGPGGAGLDGGLGTGGDGGGGAGGSGAAACGTNCGGNAGGDGSDIFVSPQAGSGGGGGGGDGTGNRVGGDGGLYGAGGGGPRARGAAGAGRQGLIVITYTPYVAPEVSCSVSAVSTDFGLLTADAIYTSNPNINAFMSCTSTISGCTLSIQGTGSSTEPGLWNSVDSHLIASADATLSEGIEGYGIQATSSDGGWTLNPKYVVTGNQIGGLTIAITTLASSTADISNYTVTVIHKAARSAGTPPGSYQDTITYSCTLN